MCVVFFSENFSGQYKRFKSTTKNRRCTYTLWLPYAKIFEIIAKSEESPNVLL